jgi:predicted SPOUT superfamily RNA methylase MTH1
VNYFENGTKGYTTSIVVPSSIVDNAQSLELKTYLVSQIAKAAAVYQVNEIIVLSNDKS